MGKNTKTLKTHKMYTHLAWRHFSVYKEISILNEIRQTLKNDMQHSIGTVYKKKLYYDRYKANNKKRFAVID